MPVADESGWAMGSKKNSKTRLGFAVACAFLVLAAGMPAWQGRSGPALPGQERFAGNAATPAAMQGERGDSVDVVLLLDCSMSMTDDDKIANAKLAASTFVGLMQLGDAVGVVSFNQKSKTEFPLMQIVSEETRDIALFAINAIRVSGYTSIGSGIRQGQYELKRAYPRHRRAMLLLSDGKENVPPYVADVLPEIPEETNIFVIGLGKDVEGELLNHIAAATGGTYHFIPSPQALQFLYVFLQGKISGKQLVATFADTISAGEVQPHVVEIDSLTSLATFSVTFQKGDLDLQLVSPGGTRITPHSVDSAPDISYTEGAMFDLYTIVSPEAGAWSLHVSGVEVVAPEPYTVTVQAISDLEADLFLDENEYEAGRPILISTHLQENGQPILGAAVAAEMAFWGEGATPGARFEGESPSPVEQPMPRGRDSSLPAPAKYAAAEWAATSASSMPLFDDGNHDDGRADDGIYANYCRNTVNAGHYTFRVFASGYAPSGGAFSRETMRTTYVTASSAPAVVSISPDSARQGDTVPLVIHGARFADAAQVAFSGTGIEILSVTALSEQIQVRVAIAPEAPPGYRSVTVTNPDGLQSRSPALFFVAEIPSSFELLQNYPNPFYPATTITYSLPQDSHVMLQVFNALGQRVKLLVDADLQAGVNTVHWDGLDDSGRRLASGIYFYQLLTPKFKKTKKLIFLQQ